jgi:NAD(P)-dependent dehydrogenase (short-subunit alcohol dehydrogenase family)
MRIRINNYTISKNGIHPAITDFKNVPPKVFSKKGDSLNGKTALITGGYRGIGLAMVKSFLREGAKVVFTGRNAEQMKDVYNSLGTSNVSYMEWDIADIKNCTYLMEKAFGFFGTVDILVNNAGVVSDGPRRRDFLDMDDEYIKYIHDINVIGTITMCQTFCQLIKGNHAKIINIISNTAFFPAYNAYRISKWSLLSYTFSLKQLCKDNILVNGIAPGPIKTDMSWKRGDSIIKKNIANLRLGLPEEVAELAVMLAGQNGDLISGQVFLCDGGQVLK